MSKTKNGKFVLLIIAVLVLTGGIYYFLFQSEYMQIDSCLDAGGKWIEDEKRFFQP